MRSRPREMAAGSRACHLQVHLGPPTREMRMTARFDQGLARSNNRGYLRVTGQIALNRSSKGFDMRFKTEKLNWSELSALIRRMLMAVSTSYRPELHYMRGPGPKWREKHARPPR